MSIPAPAQVVLASASEARADLLRKAGVSLQTHRSDVDEDAIKQRLLDLGHGAASVALRLAEEKALDVSAKIGRALVIGGDQTLELGARLYSKAGDRTSAQQALRALAGRSHTLHSAFAFAWRGRLLGRGVEKATLRMRPLGDEDISRYLDDAGPGVYASVGCYHFEALGRGLFDGIRGDQSTILGLPLTPVLNFLRTWAQRAEASRC